MTLFQTLTRTALVAFFLALLLSTFKIHGFSLAQWHHVIDETSIQKPSEILLGDVRDIRSDDWMLDLPQVFSQMEHRPQFPVINSLIGSQHGQMMFGPMDFPMKSFVGLFRPWTWGFWINGDFGLGWFWWGRIAGLWIGFFALALILLQGENLIAASLATAILWSPYFQFWSYNTLEVLVHALGLFFGLVHLLKLEGRVRFSTLGWGVWCAWNVGAMVLGNIYPPRIMASVLGLLFILLGLIFSGRIRIQFRSNSFRLATLIFVFLSGSIAVMLLSSRASEWIHLVKNTEYPGLRFSTGGEMDPTLFLSPFFFFARTRNIIADAYGNVCEAANFIFLSPVVLIALLLRGFSRPTPFTKGALWMVYSCVGGLVLMSAFTFVGIPHWLAQITLLSRCTSNRSQLAFGILDFALVAWALVEFRRSPLSLRVAQFTLGVWILILIYTACRVGHIAHYPVLWHQFAGVALAVGLGALLLGYLRTQKKVFLKSFLFLLILANGLMTFQFNPWVRGGFDVLKETKLAQAILSFEKIGSPSDQQPRWISIDSKSSGSMQSVAIGNFFRMIGVPSVGGYLGQPQFEFWKILDPQGEKRSFYNRCGFFSFVMGEHLEFELHGRGALTTTLPEGGLAGILKKMNVSYVLLHQKLTDPNPIEKTPGLSIQQALGVWKIYHVD